MKFALLCGKSLSDAHILLPDGNLDLRAIWIHFLECDQCSSFYSGLLIGTCERLFAPREDL